jgi:hypothetical protein
VSGIEPLGVVETLQRRLAITQDERERRGDDHTQWMLEVDQWVTVHVVDGDHPLAADRQAAADAGHQLPAAGGAVGREANKDPGCVEPIPGLTEAIFG